MTGKFADARLGSHLRKEAGECAGRDNQFEDARLGSHLRKEAGECADHKQTAGETTNSRMRIYV